MIRVDVLGGFHVHAEGRAGEELSHQPMRAALLALIAVERQVTRDRVLDMLWPDRDAERARRSLNQTVYELRRALGDDCIVVAGDRLRAGEHLRTDLAIFEEAAANGDRAAALDIYHGPFLAGVFLAPTNEFEDWVSRHHSRLTRLQRKLRLELIEQLRADGQLQAALTQAARAADDDPLEDDYQHRYIELLIANGRRTAALRQFEQYRERLAAQGLVPLEHTRALVEALQAQPAVAAGDVASPDSPAPPAPAPPPTGQTRSRRRLRALVQVSGAILLMLLVLVAWPRSAELSPATPTPARLAVLYFDDLSPESRYGYLARALTESLIDELQRRVPTLNVISKNGVAPYRGGEVAQDSIIRALSPTLLVGGSIAVLGDSVTVRVQLVDGLTQKVVRALKLRRGWSDELALMDEVVDEVVATLQPTLGSEIQRLDWAAGTHSGQAFGLYLQAVELEDASHRLTGTGDWLGADHVLADADSLLELATHADPDWCRPTVLRARIAQGRATLAMFLQRTPASPRTQQLLAAALGFADDAVRRAPADADALATRGAVRIAFQHLAVPPRDLERRRALTESAAADLHRAVSADPRAAEAWLLLSDIHYDDGQFASAFAAARQAYQADAYLHHAAKILERLAMSAIETGRMDEARHWCLEGQRRFGGDARFLACRSLLFALHDPPLVDSALDMARAAAALPRFAGVPTLLELNAALAMARAGMADSAHALMDETRRAGFGSDDALWQQAAVHAALGERDSAVHLLRAYYQRFPASANIYQSRLFRELRQYPGFPTVRP